MALNPDDERLLEDIYRRLEDKPLPPGDPLYEAIYSRPGGEDPVAKLQLHVKLSPVESLQLFSGFRGMGKTTELFRLRQQLADKGFLVLYADALDYLSPSEEVDVTTMMMSVAGAFGEQMENVNGVKPGFESFWQCIGNYLTRTTLELSEISAKAEVGAPAKELLGDFKALDVKMALKTAPSFRQKLRRFLADRLYELKAEVAAFVERIVKRVREELGAPNLKIILLFDQFEQLRGSRSNEQAVLDSVERLFANHIDMLKLPYVHVIYTVPPWLQFVRPGAFSIETLPCVRLWNNDQARTRYEPGWVMMREAIAKRFEPDGFPRIFGAGAAGQPRADHLIAMSGGHFRDLLRLFRETVVLILTWQQSLPVTMEVLDRAIVNVRNEYLPIALDDACWLEQISKRRDTALPDDKAENIGRLSRFLDTHLVLYLSNGKDWYDVHPLIRDDVISLASRPDTEKT